MILALNANLALMFALLTLSTKARLCWLLILILALIVVFAFLNALKKLSAALTMLKKNGSNSTLKNLKFGQTLTTNFLARKRHKKPDFLAGFFICSCRFAKYRLLNIGKFNLTI